ncbi:MAG: AAA family ATPase [Bacteroidia bacterium]
MKKRYYPTSHQNFEQIITKGLVYVDKTAYFYELLDEEGALFFSRPRRFGKSMMISTMKAIYEGKKHLFEGLWIYDKIDWEEVKHPVIHLDFTKVSAQQSLSKAIALQIDKNAAIYGCHLTEENDAKEKLIELLEIFAAQGKTAVFLIDEYDMPLTDALYTPKYEEVVEILASFYGALKGAGELLHQVIITGISKFGQVSLFSKLSNLTDISMDEPYMKMCGFTQEELVQYFSEDIKEIAEKLGMSEKKIWKKIQEEYNGYSWNGKDKLYCPFLIMRFLRHKAFRNYWSDTGTPTLLVKLMRKEKVLPFDLEEIRASEVSLSQRDIYNIGTVGMLFQTGYLTIKKIKRDAWGTNYYLSYPNNEVRYAFEQQIFANYLEKTPEQVDMNYIDKLRRALEINDVPTFISICQSAFSSIAYQQIANSDEAAFHAIMHLLVKLTGLRIVPEVPHNIGRADNIIFMPERIFILEYKFNGKAADALKQIIDKNYAQPFENEGFPFTYVGINFNSEKRNIDEFDYFPKELIEKKEE